MPGMLREKVFGTLVGGVAKEGEQSQARPALFTFPLLVLGGLVVAGAGLRLYLLGGKSIWLDEAFSIALSRRGSIDLLRMVVLTDVHPPFYYLLLKLWLGLGVSEGHVRLLSAIFSLASIWLMYYVARVLYEDKRAGLIAAAILTFSPFHIWYGQETRMYALLTFFILSSAYFFIRALRYGSFLDWVGFTLATTLALYTDIGAIWYTIAIGAFFLVSARRFSNRIVGWFASHAGIGLLFTPWLPFLLKQASQFTGDAWLPPPSFQAVLGSFLDFNSFNFPWMALSVLYMATIFVWAYIVPEPDSWQRRLVTLWLFVPTGISLLFSLRQPIFLSRNLIAASLGYYLLVTGTIWKFNSRRATAALLLPLIAMNLVSIGYNTWGVEKEAWREVAAYVAQDAGNKDGGLLLFVPGYAEIPFRYYFQRYDLALATQGYPADEILLHPRPKEVDDIGSVFEDRQYVWLVLRDVETVDPDWEVKNWLDTHGYVRTGDLTRNELTVISYVRWDVIQPLYKLSNQTVFSVYLPVTLKNE
ncbi:MAG: glycosyltransferase family 39 protein [Chloroflexi bacterium]|nr:glycosyltransferase family 39 protein [Chloroflexota bacterium]MCI0580267.1 glycosyltransferase family 39 protein [Chloroflexota bacterium]MCI0643678.1 glycosyltransferase family 39 protein [Chloroflexota bacterium]MCI0729062.1 glycosyltransferase family 39 protein [Chloroflexota bacterium]